LRHRPLVTVTRAYIPFSAPEWSLRAPRPVFGLGLLEAIPAATLEAVADPDDSDGDGISGRPNRVWDVQAEAEAIGREWRTPPLWGLGLADTVTAGTEYLHDGRARTVEEAILWHGGEAELSAGHFRALAAQARTPVLRFLHSL
jgi:CxxC motif-containing protein (DUF1111 family)